MSVISYMRKFLDGPHPLKRVIPPQIKRPARKVVLASLFRQAMRELKRLGPGEVPNDALLRKLKVGWDNEGFGAKLDYLKTITESAAITEGPILECGSGLTTLLLGQLAGQRNIETWSLEHNAEWHERVSSALKKHQLKHVNLCSAPLRNYEGFNWYDPPLDRMPAKFKLVICDGPPDLANGGRYGLLPVLGGRLDSGAVILFDDAEEPGQPEVLRRWATEQGVKIELRGTGKLSFAVVTCP